MSHSRVLAAVFAAALSLSAAGVAAADTVSETLTVSTAMSLSGVPASIAYGTIVPGAPSAAQTFGMTASANTAWKVYFNGSAFTGPGTLTAAARELEITSPSGTSQANYTSWTSFGTGNLQNGTAAWQGDPGTFTATANLRVNPPPATAPGAYTGSFTVTIGS